MDYRRLLCLYRKRAKLIWHSTSFALSDNMKENRERERDKEVDGGGEKTLAKRRLDIDFETALRVFPPTMFRVAHSDNVFVSVAMSARGCRA